LVLPVAGCFLPNAQLVQAAVDDVCPVKPLPNFPVSQSSHASPTEIAAVPPFPNFPFGQSVQLLEASY
jgi:hypothetical protein